MLALYEEKCIPWTSAVFAGCGWLWCCSVVFTALQLSPDWWLRLSADQPQCQ